MWRWIKRKKIDIIVSTVLLLVLVGTGYVNEEIRSLEDRRDHLKSMHICTCVVK